MIRLFFYENFYSYYLKDSLYFVRPRQKFSFTEAGTKNAKRLFGACVINLFRLKNQFITQTPFSLRGPLL
jgi:hypothetical protein